ncbi:hypothetical protein [Neptunomonas japonica]|uniref:hypothetical protein n=1 Tax=Neptunomonas japonica TaxID=417574 RepID=UPI00048E3EF4|nr:hypothetical protein [Neptunomonas japonica]
MLSLLASLIESEKYLKSSSFCIPVNVCYLLFLLFLLLALSVVADWSLYELDPVHSITDRVGFVYLSFYEEDGGLSNFMTDPNLWASRYTPNATVDNKYDKPSQFDTG